MSGRRSPCRRSRWAIRQLKPDESIVTTASGRAAWIAATALRTWRKITGARGTTSATPAIARSESGARLSMPCARMCSPPMPASRRPSPTRSRNAAISAPPSASPEGSPVMIKMKGEGPIGTSRYGYADHKQTGRVGGTDDLVAVNEQCRTSLDGDTGEPGLDREAHRLRPNGRPVDPLFLPRLLDFDQHTARPIAPQPGATPQQRIGALDRLDPEHHPLLHHHGLPDIERAHGACDIDAAGDVGRRIG